MGLHTTPPPGLSLVISCASFAVVAAAVCSSAGMVFGVWAAVSSANRLVQPLTSPHTPSVMQTAGASRVCPSLYSLHTVGHAGVAAALTTPSSVCFNAGSMLCLQKVAVTLLSGDLHPRMGMEAVHIVRPPVSFELIMHTVLDLMSTLPAASL